MKYTTDQLVSFLRYSVKIQLNIIAAKKGNEIPPKETKTELIETT